MSRKWGCFKLQIRGAKKWTTLRTNRALYYGDGYVKTKDEAEAAAREEMIERSNKQPDKQFRIVTLSITVISAVMYIA